MLFRSLFNGATASSLRAKRLERDASSGAVLDYYHDVGIGWLIYIKTKMKNLSHTKQGVHRASISWGLPVSAICSVAKYK